MKTYKTIPQMLESVNSEFKNPKAFNDKIEGKWYSLSTQQFFKNVRNLSLSLRKLGIKEGNTVAIISNTNTKWIEMDYAIMSLGAISVPLFPNTSISNLEYEVKDANINFIFLASSEKIEYFKTNHDKFSKIIVTDNLYEELENFVKHSELYQKGEQEHKANPHKFENLIHKTKESDVASIIYTSGSTGIPKGVMLTHKNLIFQLKAIHPIVGINSKDSVLSFLPTAHIFERTIVNLYTSCGAAIHFTHDIEQLGELIKEVKPHMLTVVPRFIEKVYAKMKIKLKSSPFIKKIIGQMAFQRALEKEPFSENSFMDKMYEKLVYKKLREALGGNLKKLVAGGSALSDKSFRFFQNIGVPLYPGYGLTEFSPVVSTTYEQNCKMGTVGKALEGVEVKIGDRGEILVRGDSVMKAYLNKPEETAKHIDQEGFLHTGDKGEIDSEGYITITGRIKELYKSSTGEYVSPVAIEDKLGKHELIDMAVVIGENRRFTSALLFPDFDNFDIYKRKRRAYKKTDQEFINSHRFKHEIEEFVKHVNKSLNHWEKIQKYKIMPSRLSIEQNEITPKFSLNRQNIYEHYKSEIDEIYEYLDK